jgi:hypothetical protein
MRELLPVPEASCFLSLLLLPKATDGSNTRYNSLKDTLAHADAWLLSSQASGGPFMFMNVQTEVLLTKISGETALSTVNMASLSDLADIEPVRFRGLPRRGHRRGAGRPGDTRLVLELHRATRKASKLLVLSCVGGEKVLP